MQVFNSVVRYGQVARVLHWTSVALLVTCVVLSAQLEDQITTGEKSRIIAEHASFGILLLFVMSVRLYWRYTNINPVLSYTIASWQKRAAISMHWFLYAAVLTQCLVGVLQLVADGSRIAVFEIVLWDSSGMYDEALRGRLNDVHDAIADAIYVAIAIHVTAAIYHQVFGVVEDTNQ